jgi:hypothetical protein
MYAITICFGHGAVWALMFKDGQRAIEAFDRYKITSDNIRAIGTHNDDLFEAADDFGQTIRISCRAVTGMMLEDMEHSKLAYIERGLHQARTQTKANEIANNDPVLREARRQQQSPILQPGMFPGPNGRFS